MKKPKCPICNRYFTKKDKTETPNIFFHQHLGVSIVYFDYKSSFLAPYFIIRYKKYQLRHYSNIEYIDLKINSTNDSNKGYYNTHSPIAYLTSDFLYTKNISIKELANKIDRYLLLQ